MIHYLDMEEKQRCRGLWEEAFPEDSRSFGDYYFSEKIKDNRILVQETDGRIVSMLHLNPYRLAVGDRIWQSEYIVGVATAKDRRHQGLMRELLTSALQNLWSEEMPFCFLMPADEQIYLPFDFTYIFDQPQWEMKKGSVSCQPFPDRKQGPSMGAYLEELALWMNGWLRQRFEVFSLRDQAYLKRLFKELDSEDGHVELLYDGERRIGLRSEWGLGKKVQRFLFCEPQYLEETGKKKPAIMARIVCLSRFLRAIRLTPETPEEELVICLEVQDPLIEGNQGRWRWHLNRQTSWIEPWKAEEVSEMLSLSIGELTSWLFGYQMPEQAGAWEKKIRTLQGVFLDEVV